MQTGIYFLSPTIGIEFRAGNEVSQCLEKAHQSVMIFVLVSQCPILCYVYSLCLIAHLYGVLNRYYLLIALSARRSLLASSRTAKTSRMFVDSSIELGPGSGPKQVAEFFLVANIQASVSEYWNAVDWAWKKCWVLSVALWMRDVITIGQQSGDRERRQARHGLSPITEGHHCPLRIGWVIAEQLPPD